MLSRASVPFALAFGLAPLATEAADRPVVVELFTSQGCSSCPPANAYLNDLARDRRDVLPLAFHVTYWDRLGWKDPFFPGSSHRPPGALWQPLRRRLLHAGDRHRRPLQPCRVAPERSRCGDRSREEREPDRRGRSSQPQCRQAADRGRQRRRPRARAAGRLRSLPQDGDPARRERRPHLRGAQCRALGSSAR